MKSAADKLALAQRHLEKVRYAWDEPTDWADLSLYGFYALEAAVDAACRHLEIASKRTHSNRVEAAKALCIKHGLVDVSDLILDLNTARKSEAYGDVVAPDLDAEDVANEIEEYIESVARLIEGEAS